MTPSERTQSETVLEPELTKWDKRVLNALDVHRWRDCDGKPQSEWPPVRRMNAWQVAEKLRHYNVAEVRDTLDGLVRFHHCYSRGFDHRKTWVRVEH